MKYNILSLLKLSTKLVIVESILAIVLTLAIGAGQAFDFNVLPGVIAAFLYFSLSKSMILFVKIKALEHSCSNMPDFRFEETQGEYQEEMEEDYQETNMGFTKDQ